MKKIFTIVATVLLTSITWAQSPQKMSYQAVIRNAVNALVTNQSIGLQVTILQGSVSGTEVFKEIYNPNPVTNANGLVTIQIGSGLPFLGAFSSINWANGPYFIKTETDPNGGTNYTIVGISELLSVPYALFSANGTPGPQGPAGPTGGYPIHTIGESYGGGIVFFVYDNGQHGLIAASADQSSGTLWYNGIKRYTGTQGIGLGAGSMNTTMLVAMQLEDNPSGNFAAKVCADYSVTVEGITYGDWYLPSTYELNLLYLQKSVVGGFTANFYWSSNEYSLNDAWGQSFGDGVQYNFYKDLPGYVRAIRAF